MNKKQLAAKISQEIGSKKKEAEFIIDTLLNTITQALKEGKKVRLVGFGNFVVRTRASREGRNPQTGDKIKIPPTKAPAFVPGSNLKKVIKEEK